MKPGGVLCYPAGIGVKAVEGLATNASMHWFRTNVRFGAGLALVALAIQIALSLVHAHFGVPTQPLGRLSLAAHRRLPLCPTRRRRTPNLRILGLMARPTVIVRLARCFTWRGCGCLPPRLRWSRPALPAGSVSNQGLNSVSRPRRIDFSGRVRRLSPDRRF